MHQRNSKVNISKDEFKKIEKSIQNPEFREMLGDYMLEISDPKNQAEYDQYLEQLKNEKELPDVS